MRRVVASVVLAGSVALAAVVGYEVAPRTAAWAGKVSGDPQYGGVGQGFVACFDSVEAVHLFIGFSEGNAPYRVDIGEPGGPPMMSSFPVEPAKDHDWAVFDSWQTEARFTKGKTYVATFTRTSGPDSLMYYYDSTDAYEWSSIILPGQQVPTDDPRDLACRLYCVMDPVGWTLWSADQVHPYWWDIENRWSIWRDRAVDAGLATVRLDINWAELEPQPGQQDFVNFDTALHWIQDEAGCDVAGLLVCTPRWASSRIDSTWHEGQGESYWEFDTSVHCPPRNLWVPAETDSNYWHNWLELLADRYGSRIGSTIMWNEPNDVETTHNYPGVTGWWKKPNRYYNINYDCHDLCSLYLRMCWLADSVFNTVHGLGCPIAVGDPHCVHEGNWPPVDGAALIPGADWVEMCYLIAESSYGGPFWDAVSVHPYQPWACDGFVPDTLLADAGTLRAIMAAHGHRDAELWSTEFSNGDTDRVGEMEDADNLCASFVTTEASKADPGGRYDRMYWWYFYRPRWWGSWGLVDSFMEYHAAFYAFRQACSVLTGKRFNRLVLSGDTAVDNNTRTCEFEETGSGKRTWVCWAVDPSLGGDTRDLRLPVRCDVPDTLRLAYDDGLQQGGISAGADGWCELTATSRAYFVTEVAESLHRPDVRVDSVQYVPAELLPGPNPMLVAWITNHGNRATPDDELLPHPYSTWVVFKRDTATVGEVEYDMVIDKDEQINVGIELEEAPEGSCLYSARANPTQLYVERYGLDDNTGFLLREE